MAQMMGGGYTTLALRPEALADDCAQAAVIGRDQLQKRRMMVLRQTRSGLRSMR
jgi:hypothetical protein